MEIKVEKVMKLTDLKPVQGGSESVDLEQFDKKEVEIEYVEIQQVPSQYTETKTAWVLLVKSKVLATIGDGEDKIEFRASELFNLMQDKEGNLLGYPEAEGSNLAKFMKDIKAKSPAEIVGKKALIKSYPKGEKTYLKFRY
jgi:hypothetical protein